MALTAGAAALAAVGRRGAASPAPRRFFFGGSAPKVSGGTIYGFTVKDIDGNDVSLREFEGKVALIVNVASK